MKKLDESNELKYELDRHSSYGTATITTITQIMRCYMYSMAIYFVLDRKLDFSGKTLSGGDIQMVSQVVLMGMMVASFLNLYMMVLTKAQVSMSNLFEVIDAVPDVRDQDGAKKIDRDTFKGEFEFKNVDFNYPTRPDLKILNNLSITMEAGKTTAFVGPSGSGKFTIIQIVERFYNPVAG